MLTRCNHLILIAVEQFEAIQVRLQLTTYSFSQLFDLALKVFLSYVGFLAVEEGNNLF